MTSRIGVFGGMFDPVHIGHVEAARYAAKELQLTKLNLVPCKLPNHRKNAFSTGLHRVNMLELAIGDDDILRVDQQELVRDGVSYMVDTLESTKRSFPDDYVTLILGVDSFNSLPAWHRFDDIFKVANVYVLPRDDESMCTQTLEALRTLQRPCVDKEKFLEETHGHIYRDKHFKFPASSTEVRSLLTDEGNASKILDTKVLQYIRENSLYN